MEKERPGEVLMVVYGYRRRLEGMAAYYMSGIRMTLSAWGVKPLPSLAQMMGWRGTERDPAFVSRDEYERFPKRIPAGEDGHGGS